MEYTSKWIYFKRNFFNSLIELIWLLYQRYLKLLDKSFFRILSSKHLKNSSLVISITNCILIGNISTSCYKINTSKNINFKIEDHVFKNPKSQYRVSEIIFDKKIEIDNELKYFKKLLIKSLFGNKGKEKIIQNLKSIELTLIQDFKLTKDLISIVNSYCFGFSKIELLFDQSTIFDIIAIKNSNISCAFNCISKKEKIYSLIYPSNIFYQQRKRKRFFYNNQEEVNGNLPKDICFLSELTKGTSYIRSLGSLFVNKILKYYKLIEGNLICCLYSLDNKHHYPLFYTKHKIHALERKCLFFEKIPKIIDVSNRNKNICVKLRSKENIINKIYYCYSFYFISGGSNPIRNSKKLNIEEKTNINHNNFKNYILFFILSIIVYNIVLAMTRYL